MNTQQTFTINTDPPASDAHYPLVELRQYTLHEGKRDTLIELFEREFIETQEAVGMKVLGIFTDLDRPDRFVWLRGFKDMEARATGLAAFYDGPAWKAHCDLANATMIDSDNVLLLRAPRTDAEFDIPSPARQFPHGLVIAAIYNLSTSADVALKFFENEVMSLLIAAGVTPLAWLITETAPNNFPRLPVREGEDVLVWFTRFDSELDHRRHEATFARAAAAFGSLLEGGPEILRLRPTARSQLR